MTDLAFLAYHGLIQPLLFRGKYRGAVRKPCNSALLRLKKKLDRQAEEKFWA